MAVASMANNRPVIQSSVGMIEPTKTKLATVTFVTNFLPFPVDHGGAMAREGFIRALSSSAVVDVLVLTSTPYDDAVLRAAEKYYTVFCRSFRCYRFANLSPKGSLFAKAWDYLRGYPRNGFWSEESAAVLEEQIKAGGCDVVCCDTVFNAKYLAQARQMNCRTILTNHNVESDLSRAQSLSSGDHGLKAWLNWVDLRRLERLGTRLADVVTAITEEDLEYYRRLEGENKAALLGYSYATPAGKSDASREEEGTVCFVGNMSWMPNVRAAQYLVNEIMPLVWKSIPDAKCYIVGKNPPREVSELQSSNVVVTGEVASLQEYYQRAQIVVAPLLEGSGIKVKVAEALALGKPVVTTKVGAAGLNGNNGTHLAIADDPRAFAQAIVRLLQDQDLREKTAAAARDFARAWLSPANTERQARAILERL